MATELTQEAVLKFLCSKNGRVKNSDLLDYFKRFLREDENRTENRELFKRFVNSVAVVKREEGVSFVLLRKKYTDLVRYVGDTTSPKTPYEKTANAKEPFLKDDSSGIQEKGQTNSQTDFKVKGKKPSHVGYDSTLQKNPDKILLAAGIVNSNTETVNIETTTSILPLHTAEHSPPPTVKEIDNRPCTLKPSELHLQSNESGETCQQVQTGRVSGGAVFPSSQSPDLTGAVQENICIADQGQSKESYGKSKSSSLDCEYNEIKIIVPENVTWNNVQSRLRDDSLNSSLESVGASQPLHNLLASNPRISSSTPCLLDCSESANNLPDYQLTAHSNGSLPRLNDRLRPHFRENSGEEALFGPQSVRHSLPLDNARSHPPGSFAEHHHARLSTSHGDLLLPPYDDSAWPEIVSKGGWSSDDSFNYKELPGEQEGKVREMLERAQEARLFAKLRSSEGKVGPLHHSMGNLDDQEPGVTEAGSGSTSPITMRPSARRTRSQLRSRLCRSLGADLDQPFFEDGVSARINRLHLLSSSLSFNYSTPPRTHSYGDVSSHGSGSGRIHPVSDGSGFHRNSMVPLDPKEHDWMVKAAAGTWTDIYSLFRDEPGLLNKRDFISGYTVLHWIAKHGDHRVLNTLWYGVSKMGMNLDIDAKTTCGYTPLHLAAMHGHKKLIRLLVHKFKANVAMRDTSGKKPWQYIGKGGPRDLLHLLGAPANITGGYISNQPASVEKLMTRPGTMSPKVKRHSSIAAFLKHKSLLKVSSHPEAFL